MGGAASLPEEVSRAPADAVCLSVNQHGCLLKRCDYIVACDDKPGARFAGPNGKVDLKSFGAPIISPRISMATYRIFERPLPNNSGIIAAWVAWLMGCAPVLLAGFDCYTGRATYWHSPKADSAGRGQVLARHLDKWRKLIAAAPEAVLRSMGGPLTTIFPAYRPDEVYTPTWPPVEDLRARVYGKRVRTVRQWRAHPPGVELQVGVIELNEGLREKSLVLL